MDQVSGLIVELGLWCRSSFIFKYLHHVNLKCYQFSRGGDSPAEKGDPRSQVNTSTVGGWRVGVGSVVLEYAEQSEESPGVVMMKIKSENKQCLHVQRTIRNNARGTTRGAVVTTVFRDAMLFGFLVTVSWDLCFKLPFFFFTTS